MKLDYRHVVSYIRGLATLLIIFLAQPVGTLRAETPARPVSVGIPTNMIGEISSQSVSVVVPAALVGELSSKPVSVALPYIVPDNSYMSKPVSAMVQTDECGEITIATVQGAINMYLGLKAVDSCVDVDGNGAVSIAEVQRMINLYLGL